MFPRRLPPLAAAAALGAACAPPVAVAAPAPVISVTIAPVGDVTVPGRAARCPVIAGYRVQSAEWRSGKLRVAGRLLPATAAPGLWRCALRGRHGRTAVRYESLAVHVDERRRRMMLTREVWFVERGGFDPVLRSSHRRRVAVRVLRLVGGSWKPAPGRWRFTQTVRRGNTRLALRRNAGRRLPKGAYRVEVRPAETPAGAALVQQLTMS